jgi:hypothetical protein
MKIKTFNAANTAIATRSSKDPVLSFSSKTGVFRFNKSATELLQLKVNEQLEFAQDEDDQKNWFMLKSEKDGFEVRDKKGLTFNNVKLAGHLVSSLNGEASGTNYKIKIVDQPVTLEGKQYFPLQIASTATK